MEIAGSAGFTSRSSSAVRQGRGGRGSGHLGGAGLAGEHDGQGDQVLRPARAGGQAARWPGDQVKSRASGQVARWPGARWRIRIAFRIFPQGKLFLGWCF